MYRQVLVITMLLPVLSGCVSYARPMGYTNSSIADVKQGRDCRIFVLGIGSVPDVTATQAMRQGGITKLRLDEYRVYSFEGFGRECVIVHGE